MAETISEIGRKHLVWALTDGVGPIVFSRLLVQFGGVDAALGAPAARLKDVKGIGRDTADKIARTRDAAEIEEEIAAAAEAGVRILCREDAEYPALLKRIADPPIVLYAKGELRDTDAISLAIVGSRKCTIYGSEQARRFGELFAQAGFTVVSGLARGIDAFGHHGAVDCGGRSIAVLGNGLREIYPPENQTLAEKLLENGALVSELPMRANVRAANFPSRNRVIAGITLGTLVVEAANRSGALITARLASEYNREVFAVPGRLQDPMSQGTNSLIRDGSAKLVTCLDDVLDELGEVGAKLKQGMTAREAAAPASASGSSDAAETENAPTLFAEARGAGLTEAERRVFEVIGFDPVLQDVVLSRAELPPGEVLAAFTALELKGLIRRLPGQLVVRRGVA